MQRAALAPGTRLGELEVMRMLADGGFGIVYLARDHSLNRDVAVKEFMPAQLVERSHGVQVSVRSGTSAEAFAIGLRAFIEEARLLASFSHPAIVKVYQFWEANGTGYMVMPYLHGPTLVDVRRSMSESPTEAWMRSMIEPLLDALALLHTRGVCHRDVAPDNVVVTSPGQPVLLDFGAARRLIGDPARPVTAVVKPSYAPIEQYADAAHLQQGPWTDLYGVAALVGYLIDGIPPPAATTRCVHDDMVPLAQRKIAGVSPRFLAAMDWAFAVRPHDRPHSVAALREALDGRPAVRWMRMRHGLVWMVRRAGWRLSATPHRPIRAPAAFGLPLAAAAALLVLVAGSRATLEGVTPSRAEPPRVMAMAVVPPPATAPAEVKQVAAIPAQAKPEVEEFIETESAAPASVAAPLAASPVPPPRRAPRRAAARKMLPVADLIVTGPRELCATRNFFMRPFCVQRLCNADSRFKRRAECAAPVARNEHY